MRCHPHPLGLRERKKLATRAALGETALRLALDGGLASVTGDDVAAAAGVSARTFRNYFGSVEEAVVCAIDDRAEAVITGLEARPAGEPPWDSLAALLPDAVVALVPDRARARALTAMFEGSALLLGLHLARFDTVEQRLARTIAARAGLDADRDVRPHLLAAQAMLAVKVSTQLWVSRDDGRDLATLVRECLTHLRAGIGVVPAHV